MLLGDSTASSDQKAGHGVLEFMLITAFVYAIVFFSYREGYTYVSKLVGLLLGAVFLLEMVFRQTGPRFPREFQLLFAWLFYATVSGFLSLDITVFASKLWTELQIVGIGYVIFNLSIFSRQPAAPLLGIYIATLSMSLLVLWDPSPFEVQGRLAGTLGNANLFGLALVASLVYAGYKIFSVGSKASKVPLLGSAALFIYTIGLTGSRKAIVMVVVLMGMSALRFLRGVNRRFFRSVIGAAGLVGALVLVVGLYATTPEFERMREAIYAVRHHDIGEADNSLQARVALYAVAFKLFWEDPVFGVGLNNFGPAMADAGYGEGSYAHSNYMEVLATTGLIGFLLYFGIYVSILRRLLSLRKRNLSRRDRDLYDVAWALFLVLGFTDFAMVSYYEKLSWMIMASIIAIVVTLEGHRELT